MQVSARILGREYGLTGEEMNRVLLKSGFLTGIPGGYSLTEKALPYAVEKYCSSGTGGYPLRTFDDSIKEVLNVTSELISEVRNELKTIRAERNAARVTAEVWAKQIAEKAAKEAAEQAAIETEEFIARCKTAGKIVLVIGGIIAVGYGIYKFTPKVKKWWNERKQASEKEENYVT